MHIPTELFPNPKVTVAVIDYAIANSTDLGETINQHCNDTLEFAQREGLDPTMMINTLQVSRLLDVRIREWPG